MLFGFNLGVMGKAAAASYRALARIFYSSEMYTDSSMTNYLKNTGYTTQRENALVYASNHIYHDGVTHSTPCGIVHTLGSNTLNSTAPSLGSGDEISTFSSDTSNNFNLAVTTVGTQNNTPVVYNYGTTNYIAGSTYLVEFDVTVNSGTPILYEIKVGGTYVTNPTTLSSGHYEFEVLCLSSSNNLFFPFDGRNLFDISVTNWTVKEITLPAASYFHYYDTASKSIKQLSSTGNVGDVFYSDDFESGIASWTSTLDGSFSVTTGNGFTGNAARLERISSGAASKDIGLEIGGIYKVSFKYRTDSSSSSIACGGANNQVLPINTGSALTYEYLSTGGISSLLYLVPGDGSYLEIDDISIVRAFDISTKYDLSKSYQYAISATAPLTAADTAYIDANPEAMYRVLYDSLVLPSGFSSTDIVHFYDGTGGVVGGNYVQDIATALGSEVVTNGTFDTDTDWTKGTGWTISGGTLNASASTSADFTYQPMSLTIGSVYTVKFDITSYTSGDVSLYIFGSGVALGYESAVGSYQYIVKIDSLYGGNFGLRPSATFTGSIDNVSVKLTSASEIAGYTSNVRTNFLNTTYGATNLKLIKDASGRTTGVSPAGVTIWDSDSRQAVTNWTITAPFTVTEVLDGVTYTWTSDGNKYIAGVPSGTYTLPTGTWTLNDTGFDDLTAVTQRGTTKLETSVIIP